jgi:uncharacterized OB-fold protein
MNRNRICPDCGAEYHPHVQICADCGKALLLHEEYRALQEAKKRVADKFIENAAVVREGDMRWLSELRTLLIDAGIPSAIVKDNECKSGCRDRFYLVSAREDLESARARIEEYFAEMHPEIRASNELTGQGKCPACGYNVREDAAECGECGLRLVIREEEEDESGSDQAGLAGQDKPIVEF